MTKTKAKNISYPLVLGALGVVYGDIGTSPLYAMRESLIGLDMSHVDILGVLSLIFWSLILVISVKYLIFVFRADNDGEGGILALLALLKQKQTKHQYLFYLLAIFGAGLIIGDGMLTPAISVTSAIEGLKLASPRFDDYIVPLSAFIMVVLFSAQSKGTGKIGAAFGPILLIWFITIGILGLAQIIKNPLVLEAVNPYFAWQFFQEHGFRAYLLLGGVFLVVTGGEALYADIGHFGKNAIRYSWFFIVLPGLLLNYFGQGANLLLHPKAIENPFYMLAPEWFFLPLLCLSTLATIIASQAIISATFSITKQAVLLGLYPRLPIIQTSKEHAGQIYIPQVNFFLLIGTLILIFSFRSSNALAHAYGIAVNLEMLSVSVLVAYAARKIWNWSWLRVIASFTILIFIDLAFLGANSYKFMTGGWVPVLFAFAVALVMFTWNNGMQYLKKNFYMQKADITKIIKQLRYKSLNQLPGVTGIFITDTYDQSGGSFLHFLKLSLAVPENILIVSYQVENKPYVRGKAKFEFHELAPKVFELILHYGFMDSISIPDALEAVNKAQLLPYRINVESATYLVEIPNVMASRAKRTLYFYWQEKLFSFLVRNYSANLNIEFYKLPYNRTIAIGTYCMI
ncbi:potassium transporter Kup [Legionella jordanis]|uniref:Probable potassium transport system protein Kup n=1 Tax=Legionella jordanis TaxID=456 RepID=A0A0W0V9L6_9GAMM|nr:KUP/HAK/KT family potassium transporter [Legionella jordanis]KTD16855.1 KUP system potassium uptake protein [Legionella jordanis]RMX00358.1 potassium transporter Kup [Legionella jordanis]RMX15538.1 potassium transporter Kup [Legionella jordanis]VEH13552.1 KUP system potassium uptake protein [Legionella jordanis]HAT8715196.1 potassium transporter Kup [Legionella jordanis]